MLDHSTRIVSVAGKQFWLYFHPQRLLQCECLPNVIRPIAPYLELTPATIACKESMPKKELSFQLIWPNNRCHLQLIFLIHINYTRPCLMEFNPIDLQGSFVVNSIYLCQPQLHEAIILPQMACKSPFSLIRVECSNPINLSYCTIITDGGGKKLLVIGWY